MATEEQQQPRLVYENGYCGIDNNFVGDGVPDLIDFHLITGGFHFVVIALKDSGAYRNSLMERCTNSCDSLSKTSDCLVGNISSWIDLDSEDEMLRKDSEITLSEEVDFASRLCLQVCLLPAPKGSSCANYARCLNRILQDFSNIQFLLRIPLEELHDDSGGVNSNHMVDNRTDSLELWKCFYCLCKLKYHNQLSVALDFPCSLPSASSLGCWSNEPTIWEDSRGRPYCFDYQHGVLSWLFSHSIKIVLQGPQVHQTSSEYRKNHPLESYLGLLTFVHGSFRKFAELFGDRQLPPPPKVFEKNTDSSTMIYAHKYDRRIISGGRSGERSTIGEWVDTFIFLMRIEKLHSGMIARVPGSIDELLDKFREKLDTTPERKIMSKIADWIFDIAKDSGEEGDVFIVIAGPLKEIGGQFLNDPYYKPDALNVVAKRSKVEEVEVAKRVRPEWETWMTRDDEKGTLFKALRTSEIGKTGNGEDIGLLFIHKECVAKVGAAVPCH